LASLAALITFAIDILSKDIQILGEGVPNFEGIYLLRTGLIVLSSSLFVLGVVNPQSPRDVGVISHSTSRIWSSWRGLTWSIEDPVKAGSISGCCEGTDCVGSSFAFRFLCSPIYLKYCKINLVGPRR
jgi:hypothetical protein